MGREGPLVISSSGETKVTDPALTAGFFLPEPFVESVR